MKKFILFCLNIFFLICVLVLSKKYFSIKQIGAQDPCGGCGECKSCEQVDIDINGNKIYDCVNDDSQSCSCDNPFGSNYCKPSGCATKCSTSLSCKCEGGSCNPKYYCTPSCPSDNSETCQATCVQCNNPKTCPGDGGDDDDDDDDDDDKKKLVCDGLSQNPSNNLPLGTPVSFTCSHIAKKVDLDHYDYRIHRPRDANDVSDPNYWHYPAGWQGIKGATPNYPAEEQEAGEHIVQCRVCSDQANNHCTNWGQAKGWKK